MKELLDAYESRLRHLREYNFTCHNCHRKTLRMEILDREKAGTSESFPFCYSCFRKSFPLTFSLDLATPLGKFLSRRHLLLLEDHRTAIYNTEHDRKIGKRVSLSPYEDVFLSEQWFTPKSSSVHGLGVVAPDQCLGLKYLNELFDEVGSYPVLITRQYLTPSELKDATFFMHYIALMTPDLNVLSYHLSKRLLTLLF